MIYKIVQLSNIEIESKKEKYFSRIGIIIIEYCDDTFDIVDPSKGTIIDKKYKYKETKQTKKRYLFKSSDDKLFLKRISNIG